jgi:cell wall-associated NlpC family hydrolase
VQAGVLLAVIAAACAVPRASTPAAAAGTAPVVTSAEERYLPEPAGRWMLRWSLARTSDGPVAPVPMALAQAELPQLDQAALRRAERYVGTVGPWSHRCLRFVRKVYGLPARDPSAIAAWHESRSRHKGDRLPPAGVPVFWSGGGPGHVALSLGDGWVLTSDYPSAGRVTRVSISTLRTAWHLQYLGWTDDLEGVVVHR